MWGFSEDKQEVLGLCDANGGREGSYLVPRTRHGGGMVNAWLRLVGGTCGRQWQDAGCTKRGGLPGVYSA